MKEDEIEIIELELKYCERCGGLWVRARGDREVYCRTCVPEIAELAKPTKRRISPRLPACDLGKGRKTDGRTFCGTGGTA